MLKATTTPLAELTKRLYRDYPGSNVPSYRTIYSLVLDGKIETVRSANRHEVRNTDIPAIAAMLGLTVPPETVAA